MADLTAKIVPDNNVVTVPRAQATEVEPGVFVSAPPSPPPALTGRYIWRKREDGAYEPVLEMRSAMIPITEWNEKRYGISKQSIRRLCIGGFVRGYTPCPGSLLIDLNSYFEHLDRVNYENFFWDEERLARHSAARLLQNKGLGGTRHRITKASRDLVMEAVKNILASPGTLNQIPSARPMRVHPKPVRPGAEDDHPELFPTKPTTTDER